MPRCRQWILTNTNRNTCSHSKQIIPKTAIKGGCLVKLAIKSLWRIMIQNQRFWTSRSTWASVNRQKTRRVYQSSNAATLCPIFTINTTSIDMPSLRLSSPTRSQTSCVVILTIALQSTMSRLNQKEKVSRDGNLPKSKFNNKMQLLTHLDLSISIEKKSVKIKMAI